MPATYAAPIGPAGAFSRPPYGSSSAGAGRVHAGEGGVGRGAAARGGAMSVVSMPCNVEISWAETPATPDMPRVQGRRGASPPL